MRSLLNNGLPTYSWRFSVVTSTAPSTPWTILRAALRNICKKEEDKQCSVLEQSMFSWKTLKRTSSRLLSIFYLEYLKLSQCQLKIIPLTRRATDYVKIDRLRREKKKRLWFVGLPLTANFIRKFKTDEIIGKHDDNGSVPLSQSKSRFCDRNFDFLFHWRPNQSKIAIRTIYLRTWIVQNGISIWFEIGPLLCDQSFFRCSF